MASKRTRAERLQQQIERLERQQAIDDSDDPASTQDQEEPTLNPESRKPPSGVGLPQTRKL